MGNLVCIKCYEIYSIRQYIKFKDKYHTHGRYTSFLCTKCDDNLIYDPDYICNHVFRLQFSCC